jgi:cytochrome c
MLRHVLISGLLTLGLEAAVLPVIPGDSERGEKLFENERCIQCHAIDGKGGSKGPDLGRRIDRNFTPALLASAMWNHAPVMWPR